MANEAALIFETAPPIPFTVANGVGIEKGAILSLKDLMTASGTVIVGDLVAGIAAKEKIASDGNTELAVYRGGIFKVYLSGACIAGDALTTTNTANYVRICETTLSGSRIIGTALETGAEDETILMELKPGCGGIA